MNASTAASPPLPLRHCYWVIPGLLLAGEHPGGATRDKTKDRLKKLTSAGIECFLDLTKPTELPRYDTLLPFNVEYSRKAIKDHGLPASREQMVEILDTLGNWIRAGRPAYIHCRAGIGRTGTVVGCFLVERGFVGDGALDELNRLWQQSKRSKSWALIPETEAQASFVRDWQPGLGGGLLEIAAAAANVLAAIEPQPKSAPVPASTPASASASASAPERSGSKERNGSNGRKTSGPYRGAGLAAAAAQARAAVQSGEVPAPPPTAPTSSSTRGSSSPAGTASSPGSSTSPAGSRPPWERRRSAGGPGAMPTEPRGGSTPPGRSVAPTTTSSEGTGSTAGGGSAFGGLTPSEGRGSGSAPEGFSPSEGRGSGSAPGGFPPSQGRGSGSAPGGFSPSEGRGTGSASGSLLPSEGRGVGSAPGGFPLSEGRGTGSAPRDSSPLEGRGPDSASRGFSLFSEGRGFGRELSPSEGHGAAAGGLTPSYRRGSAPGGGAQSEGRGLPPGGASLDGRASAPPPSSEADSGPAGVHISSDPASEGADPLLDQSTLIAARAMRERFVGALLGLAVGDALAAPTQYRRPGTFTPVGDMLGGGPFDLPRGAWSDDTAMALCLAESLLERDGFDPRDQVERYTRWQQQGYLSSTGQCVGITASTSRSLAMAKWRRVVFPGSHDPEQCDPEPLSRIAPVVLYYFASIDTTVQQAAEASRTTCQAPAVLEACRQLGRALHLAVAGQPKAQILSEGPMMAELAAQSNTTAAKALDAALWAFSSTNNFRDAVLRAANVGGNSDVVASVCGQLAGAHYGFSAIPPAWCNSLMHKDLIESYADRLLAHALVSLST